MFGPATFFASIRSALTRFAGDRSGNIAMLFALSLPVVVGTVGLAVDFSRGSDTRVKLAAALDAAVLAAAERAANGETDMAELERIAQGVFEANIQSIEATYGRAPTMELIRDPDTKRLIATADARFDHVLLTGAQQTTDVSVRAEAAYATLDIEMAMMLDVTGSMRGNKLRDLKRASRDVIDELLGPDAGAVSERVRISLVPYSASVNAGRYAEEVTGEDDARCVVERHKGPGKHNDMSPLQEPIPVDDDAYCPSQAILPLTNRADVLDDAIGDFEASGCTAGHLGVAWAYYTLSPRWNQIWPVESQPVEYDDDETLKIAVLMTDGEFNTYYHDVSDPTCSNSAKKKSDRMAKKLCKSMRDDNIRIYSVAFQAPSAAEKLLRKCADNDDRYFEADNGTELIAAFQEIASEIRNLRLTQ